MSTMAVWFKNLLFPKVKNLIISEDTIEADNIINEGCNPCFHKYGYLLICEYISSLSINVLDFESKHSKHAVLNGWTRGPNRA